MDDLGKDGRAANCQLRPKSLIMASGGHRHISLSTSQCRDSKTFNVLNMKDVFHEFNINGKQGSSPYLSFDFPEQKNEAMQCR